MPVVRIILLLCLAVLSAPAAESPALHFLTFVKPLLDSRCVSCHGPDKVKASLRLDSREALLRGGDSGPVVIPGKPADSLLLQAVLHTKKDLEMPPKEKLTPRDIAVLEKWIRDGVPWPKTELQTVQAKNAPNERIGNAWSDPRNPIVRIFGGQRLDLWSLKPITRPAPPLVQHVRFVRNPIDSFILAKEEQAGLNLSPEAHRRTLARRLYFDLTGLPPTPEQMRAFLDDRKPGAYERLVDELLNSKVYGEHAARQWLDVVRYSDSNGFDWDEFRRNAWRFRDYVIRSFNSDKPFNQFIREQIAGDELLDGPPRNEDERDLLIATGYLRLGPHDNSAAAFNEQGRSRAELMADLVETTSSTFLGLTMGCCRCHDHKYDPLSQADHYRMRAFFEGVKFADDLPLDLADEQSAIRDQHKKIDEQIKPLQTARDEITATVKESLRKEPTTELSEKEIRAAFSEEQKKRDGELAKELDQLKKQKREFTLGLLMTDSDTSPPATKILFQGDYKTERDPVEPGFISALNPNPAEITKGKNQKTLGRRLTLANWIATENNPFTARVLVNRVWQQHFGRGLVATANDFGLAGARPSHPELLDWLANEFMRQGWSVKKLHRLIVTSATYRQASSSAGTESPTLVKIVGNRKSAASTDIENKLLARQNLRRLSAEQLRDAILAISGKLASCEGGPPIWPELPSEVLVANPAFLDDNAEKTKGWYPSPKEQQNVRSVFLVQKRTVKIPFLETFDLPENATSCPRRNESIVAPQALSLLNSHFAIEAAKSFASRVSNSDLEVAVCRAFSYAFQRSPDPDELRASVELTRQRGLPELCRALLNANEFIYID